MRRACLTCRTLKQKCDYGRPCKNCTQRSKKCDDAGVPGADEEYGEEAETSTPAAPDKQLLRTMREENKHGSLLFDLVPTASELPSISEVLRMQYADGRETRERYELPPIKHLTAAAAGQEKSNGSGI